MPPLALCPIDDPRLAGAGAALRQLDAEVRSGQHTLEESRAALEALLGHPCLALAAEEGSFAFESAQSLSLWWDAGGERWLRSYIDPADRGLVVLPPDPPPALPCESGAPCEGPAAEARGWTLEAQLALTRHGAREAGRAGLDPAACAAEPGPGGYERWWACVDRATRGPGALPLGAAAPPGEGWLVVRGSRGSCRILQVYALAGGEALLVRDCPGEAGAAGERTVQRGRVEPQRLDELVWFLSLDPDVANAQRAEAVIVPRPANLERVRAPAAPAAGPPGALFSSNQSALAWSLNAADPALSRHGTTTWPWSTDASEDYTDRLLLALERSFVAGCAPSPPGELRGGRLPEEPASEAPGGHRLSEVEPLSRALWGLPPCPG